MATYIRKERSEILRQALRKLEESTPITSLSAGSVARAFTEAITTELGDFYDALDFNTAQSVISTASGRALDMLGELYNVKRRTVSNLVTIDRSLGSFYFYIDNAIGTDIVIPTGTKVYTATDSFVGRQLRFATASEVTIAAGKKRAFASITPEFGNGLFTAGANTLVVHDFTSPPGTVVRCTNPKQIQSQPGFEDDDNYRIRIIKSIRVASSGTSEALRYAALGVTGVRDVKIREVPYGLGSVEVIVASDGGTLNFTARTEITEALKRVKPVGVRMFVKEPELIAVDIYATIVMAPNATQADITGAESRASVGIHRYINTLLPGETLIYNRLIESILDSSDGILDVQITRYAPNGVEALRRNFEPKQDEQIIPGKVEVSRA